MYHQGKHQNVTADISNIVAIWKIYCTRWEKYSSKLDISRSFVAIFVEKLQHTLKNN